MEVFVWIFSLQNLYFIFATVSKTRLLYVLEGYADRQRYVKNFFKLHTYSTVVHLELLNHAYKHLADKYDFVQFISKCGKKTLMEVRVNILLWLKKKMWMQLCEPG